MNRKILMKLKYFYDFLLLFSLEKKLEKRYDPSHHSLNEEISWKKNV